ncbi:MAG: exopolysaccharide biosynthesis protein [Verrucomicrobia bacterium]|nr:exopolysaccharide biosynthesis protein [Verrucomicrobiota bacterium]
MKKECHRKTPFLDALERILEVPYDITIREILSILAKHGHATLLLIFSLPLCLPIPLPGLSTLFGLLLGLIGIQMGFTKRLWLPKWILEKKIPKDTLKKIITKLISLSIFLQKFLHPRLTLLTKNQFLIGCSGVVISLLSLLLSIPLPIPLTNLVSTLPIIAMGLGFLEDDGLCVVIGYFLALVCFTFFFYLGYFGYTDIEHYLKN